MHRLAKPAGPSKGLLGSIPSPSAKYNLNMKFKKKVKNNKIVFANPIVRFFDTIWDFIYWHILPLRTWHWLGEQKRKVIYGFERMFTGFDRRISWGEESTIAFYKRLLSDLYKNVHGWPGTAAKMREICPLEWAEVEAKWKDKLPEGKELDDLFYIKINGIDENEYFEDGFQCWKKYIKRVLHYFEEADPETCSLNKKKEELYDQMKNPFDEKHRTVVEHNGEYFYQYPSLGDSEEDQAQRKVLDELNHIDEYMYEQLKLGMAEIAKNIIYLND